MIKLLKKLFRTCDHDWKLKKRVWRYNFGEFTGIYLVHQCSKCGAEKTEEQSATNSETSSYR